MNEVNEKLLYGAYRNRQKPRRSSITESPRLQSVKYGYTGGWNCPRDQYSIGHYFYKIQTSLHRQKRNITEKPIFRKPIIQKTVKAVANIRTRLHFSCESIAELSLMHDATGAENLIQIPYNTQKKNEESGWDLWNSMKFIESNED